jgi:hypothetical protein
MTLVELPLEFVYRIGKLERNDLVSDVMAASSLVESLFEGAYEFVLMIHYQYLVDMPTLKGGSSRLGRGSRRRMGGGGRTTGRGRLSYKSANITRNGILII